ncbi:hypothetical protein [Gordonia insulae]|uniref:Uncharacterized protein n=1 Tax=Gordonia insulae TaxID=2420509 RepID=A0A3G8JEA3_9ACTN|nr:hypothetical protein [Gordonia insulae]AZG43476.1 hypothetical protein D7316_00041 [Gordonia insulae]
MSILNDIDKALSTGSKSAFTAESAAGEKVRGPIVAVDYRQVTDFTTQQPATFPSGDPKMQFIISIQTDQRQDSEDDGVRSIYIPCWGKRKLALTEAIRESGATKGSEVMVPGVIFEVEYLGEQRVQGGPSGSYTMKAYRYAFTREAAQAADALTTAQSAPAQPSDPSGVPAGFDAATWAGLPDATKTAILAAQS